MLHRQSFVLSLPISLLSVLFSGICFYFGFSLNGNLGWLMWIAPFPILYISLYAKPGRAFQMAFLAYLIGWLSWFPYLKKNVVGVWNMKLKP
jgi:apolipoprotein N-acyltransferase